MTETQDDEPHNATGMAQAQLGQVWLEGPAKWSEHLHYDLEQLVSLEEVWRTKSLSCLGTSAQAAMYDALLDSFAMRLRGVMEFFDGDKPDSYGNRVRVSDFLGGVPQAKAWKKKHVPEELQKLFDKVWKDASEQVGHLVTRRTHDESQKEWNPTELLARIRPLLSAFARVAAPRLSQNRDWSRWR
jgi:hypothetical protein